MLSPEGSACPAEGYRKQLTVPVWGSDPKTESYKVIQDDQAQVGARLQSELRYQKDVGPGWSAGRRLEGTGVTASCLGVHQL